jgi:serine/threonine protein phosphatase 1
MLQQRLAELEFDPAVDRLFAVGDLVDRGPESARVDEFLNQPWFFSVRGNHEANLMDTTYDELTTLRNGGGWFLELSQERQDYYRVLFSTLPLAMQVQTSKGLIGFIHADVPVNDWSKLEKSSYNPYWVETMLWSRTRFERHVTEPVSKIALVVVGHTPQWTVPARLGNVLNIDGGVYKPNGDSRVFPFTGLEQFIGLSNNQTTRQPDNQTTRQPDNQTTRQADNQTTRQADNSRQR